MLSSHTKRLTAMIVLATACLCTTFGTLCVMCPRDATRGGAEGLGGGMRGGRGVKPLLLFASYTDSLARSFEGCGAGGWSMWRSSRPDKLSKSWGY